MEDWKKKVSKEYVLKQGRIDEEEITTIINELPNSLGPE